MYSVCVSQSVHFLGKKSIAFSCFSEGYAIPKKMKSNWLEYINLLFLKSFIVNKDRKSIHPCKYRATGLFKTS